MRKMMFAALMAVVGSVQLSATTWYASPAGGGDGSSAESPTTVTNALAKTADGDTVVLSEGTFETVTDELRVTNAVTVVGQGAGKTIIKAVNANGKNKLSDSQIFRRCFYVNNAGAVVKNLTMTNGFWWNFNAKDGSYVSYTDYDLKGECGGGDVVLYAGTIDNCTITGTRHGSTNADGGGTFGGGVWMKGGTVTNCVITGCKAVYNNNESGQGGGVFMRGGLVVDSVITNNTSGQYGAGVYISGGTMRGCTVSANTRIVANSVSGAVFMDGNCVVENCEIANHNGLKYAGVYLNASSAKLRNALIHDNTGAFEGAGVYMSNGRVESCTIAGNASTKTTSGTGFYMKNGTAINNVVYANEAGSDGDTTVAGGSFTYNFTTLAISGTGNQHGNAQFVDAANGDYHLIAGSKAIDAAQESANVTVDLDGVTRPQGSAPDMGCYEFVAGKGPLTVTINGPDVTTFAEVGTATFTATAGGANTNGVTYTWYFDDVEQSEKGASLTVESFGPGKHSVRVVVSTATETAQAEDTDAVRVSSSLVYVNEQGSNTYPYDTAEKGAHNLQDALDAVVVTDAKQGEVVVMDGTYPCPSTWYTVTRNVYLHSANGPETTILQGWNSGSTAYDHRVMLVENPSALVAGFTLEKGKWDSYSNKDEGCGGLRLISGVVSNCVIRNNKGNDIAGGVQQKGGLLTHCTIAGNEAYRSNNPSAASGGGVYITGGTMANCIVSNNMSCSSTAGCGVKMTGKAAVVRDCLIIDNYGKNTSTAGIGVYMEAGLLERCEIRGNGIQSSDRNKQGSGVYLAGGTMRNCLVADNKAVTMAAGVYQTAGTMEYCTIAGNEASSKSASGYYLNGNQAIARYNVLYGNGDGMTTEPNCNLSYVAAKTFATNVVGIATNETTYGVGNIYSDPLFADAANGDYTLGTGSPAIDIVDDATVTDDLDGNERPKDGKGEGVPLNDLGCYEAADASAGPLACGLAPLEATGHDNVTVTFTASASGQGSKGELHYVWDFDGGVPTTEDTDAPEVTVVFSSYGSHSVTLTVRAADGKEATAGVPGVVKVGTSHIYVNAASEDPTWPYSTPKTAATDLMEAYRTAVFQTGAAMTFDVSAGTYDIDEKWLIVSSPVHLRGVDGANVTFLRAAAEGYRMSKVLELNHADALVEGFTFCGGRWEGNSNGDHGGAVRVEAGTIRNCVFNDNEGGNTGAHLDMTGGLVTDCVFTNGATRANGNTSVGQGAVYLYAGTLANSLVVDNYSQSHGGGIYLNGETAVVSNCVVRGNRSTSTYYSPSYTEVGYSAGGVYLEKGLLTHCIVSGNYSHGEWGGVCQIGGTMRNCLVFGNYSSKTTSEGFGLLGASAQVESCTIADNGVTNKAGQVMAKVEKGTVVNTVFWGAPDKTATILDAAGGTITYSCWPTATGDTNITGDPSFHRPAKGDYRLVFDSSLIGKGEYRDWMDGATDLKGHVRVKDDDPDIGCYEYTARGVMMLVK